MAEDIFSVKQLLQLTAGLNERLNAEQFFLHSLITCPVLTTVSFLKKESYL